MAGFCQIMRDEGKQQTRDHMLDYLIALLDDCNDFSWQAAKASYVMLLCRIEQGEIAIVFLKLKKNDQIRRGN